MSSKRIFQMALLLVCLFWCYWGAVATQALVDGGGFTATALRFTAIRARRENAELWNSTGTGQIGLLKNGCRTETNISQYLVKNTTIEVHYASSIEANGYYFITSPDDASGDVDQWVVDSSADYGHSWTQIGASVWRRRADGTLDYFPFLSNPPTRARAAMVSIDQRPSWEWSLAYVFYAFQNAFSFLLCFILAVAGQKHAIKPVWMGFTAANIFVLVLGAIGYISDNNVRAAGDLWLKVPKCIAFFVGMIFFEEWALAVLFFHCILEAILLLVSDYVFYMVNWTLFLQDTGTSISACYFIFATIIIFFRQRSLRRAKRLMIIDQARYDKIWRNLLELPSTQMNLAALAAQVESIVSKRPGSVAQQLNRLCTEHRSSQRYAQLQSARASFSLKRKSARRRRSYLGMTGVPGSIDPNSPVDSLDQLYVQAMCLNPMLISKIQNWAVMSQGLLPSKLHGGHVAFLKYADGRNGPYSHIKWCKIKSVDRAIEKALRVYGQDVSRLVDICRQSIVFEEVQDLMGCLRAMDEDGDIVVVRIKNRLDPSYDSSQSAGYRDVAINFRMINPETKSLGLDTHVAEVQLMLRSFAEVKSQEGHRRYKTFRNLRGE